MEKTQWLMVPRKSQQTEAFSNEPSNPLLLEMSNGGSERESDKAKATRRSTLVAQRASSQAPHYLPGGCTGHLAPLSVQGGRRGEEGGFVFF